MTAKKKQEPKVVEPQPEEEPIVEVPSDAEPLPQPIPSDVEDEAPVEDQESDPDAEPLPKEYVTLMSNASYGPVIINGVRTMTKKGKLYYVPNAEERADILGTGRFRAATQADLARAGSPSAGPGGAVTRDLLPPGAIKGGLISHG